MNKEQLDHFIIKTKNLIYQEVGQGSAEYCILIMLILLLIVAYLIITNPSGGTELGQPNFF